VREATCTDISPGMVRTLRANAESLGLTVRTARADADSLPFAEESFDLVLGHAVLHHLPDLRRAFDEFHRVLRPGGRIAFAGEPSRFGDRLAAIPKCGATLLAPAWRMLVGARAIPDDAAEQRHHALEPFVDIHAFAPGDLSRHARRAGFERVTVRGEELIANWFGWFNRALEATAEPDQVPMLWRRYAFNGYLVLQQLDSYVLESRLPPAIFYNLLLTARKSVTRTPGRLA
jgi:SAM-dependent methyltransferase